MDRKITLAADEISAGSMLQLEEALPQTGLGSLLVEVEREPGEPMVFVPGFVRFAEQVLETFPGIGALLSLDNEFYRSLIIATAGPINAVQVGEHGRLVLGEGFLFRAMEETDVVSDHKPGGVAAEAWNEHVDLIVEYLLKSDL